MPTGYTYKISDGKCDSLREYAMDCIRALGVCITMRDDPADAPLPISFEPTFYYKEQGEQAKIDLAKVQGLTLEDAVSLSEEAREETIAHNQKHRAEQAATKARYLSMLAKTLAWDCKVDGLKSFMISQLNESISFDCLKDEALDRYYPLNPPKLTAEEWLAKEVKSAQEKVDYYGDLYEKEISRTAEKNDYLARFWECLPEA